MKLVIVPLVIEVTRNTRLCRSIIVLALLLTAATTPAFAEELEIRASLFGYNLLWPTSRCCAFDLHISGDGAATVVIRNNSDERTATKTETFQLSSKQILDLKKLIADVQFYSLPKEMCCGPVDGDQRRITVRIDNRSHQIEFGEVYGKQQKELAQAIKLWAALRATFTIPGENVK